MQNVAFDPTLVDYSIGYEDTQAHSPRFLEFATDVIGSLMARHDLRGARTLEVGCGKADFLRMVCRATGGPGIGIDPALAPGALDDEGLDLTLLARPYGAGDHDLSADLVVCRHTLEHIPDVADFLTMMRTNLAANPDTVVFVEVPDTGRVLAEGAFWDVYYEHCSYFDADSLATLATRLGFDDVDVRLGFDEQYLLLEARVGTGPVRAEPTHAPDPDEVRGFAASVERSISDLRRRFATAAESGHRIGLWGASSKAVSLLTMTEPGPEVPYAVDINPRKWGRHLAGTGLPVIGPDDIAARPVDEMLVLNPIYLEEIGRDLSARGLAITTTTLA
ncbi:MAG: class I SAM-dependent methyltransferase [Acidimicrobiales bacterium]